MLFQITFDTTQPFFDNASIHQTIVSIKSVYSWWHYLPNVYIVETENMTEQDIANEIIKKLNGLMFLVTKVNLSSSNGLLPKAAWDWIQSKSKKKSDLVKIKLANKSMLSKSNLENENSNQLINIFSNTKDKNNVDLLLKFLSDINKNK